MLIGLVGKPSSGKSTFFKAATLAEVEIANYPFTTIKPNEGMGYIKVEDVANEFNKKSNPREGYCLDKFRFVPIKLIDVAGLVPGAYEGKGKGNQFLSDLNQADVLIHVIDVSGSIDENGNSVAPLSYDPSKDIEFLEIELDMWYFGVLKKGWGKFTRTLKQENQDIKKALAKQLSGLNANEEIVQESIKKLKLDRHPIEWNDDELKSLARDLRIKTKPMIIAANKIDIQGAKLNFHKLQEKFKDYLIIPCSGDSELALKEAAKHDLIEYIPGENNFNVKGTLNEKQKNALEFIKKNVLNEFGSSGIQNILDKAVFELLDYIALFPGGVNKLEDSEGNVLPDCFLMKNGSTALDFAYRLHTDFGKNFIKAIDVRTKMTVGKDHKLKHKDIIELAVRK
ncbi:MAG: redox-regulated ATPase YchF [Candidatus Nanoarchaeia archaeon]|jgi:hypothetical protein|nr:redox-regulated ATPase YchF [Candidatus Nanoarchaeia archaeon]|tara:strand:- start:50214 stop:51404 length:1191 start_codon:yes stop_codon:yes gene_type:complete